MRGRKKTIGTTGDTKGKGPQSPLVASVPSGMSEAAQQKWAAIVPLIAAQCELESADSDALRQYCETVVRREKAVRELEPMPLILCTPNGAMQINPLAKLIAQCEGIMMKLSERFGLDPASRKRLQFAVTQGQMSPFMDFLKNGKQRKQPETEEE